MKKQYVQPKICEVDVAPCSFLASSFIVNTDSQGDFKEDFVRGHRATWGDLWDIEKEQENNIKLKRQ